MISVEKQAIPDPTSCNLHLFITLPNRKKSFAKHETLSICNTVTTLSNNEIICQNSNLLINFSLSSRYWYMFKLQTFVSLAYERANIFFKVNTSIFKQNNNLSTIADNHNLSVPDKQWRHLSRSQYQAQTRIQRCTICFRLLPQRPDHWFPRSSTLLNVRWGGVWVDGNKTVMLQCCTHSHTDIETGAAWSNDNTQHKWIKFPFSTFYKWRNIDRHLYDTAVVLSNCNNTL